MLNSRQIEAINKIGDCMIPGDQEMKGFSESRCVEAVDRILISMPERDISDLKMLLSIIVILPAFVVSGFLRFLEWSIYLPGAGLFRTIRFGLRGLVMTLYYSHPESLRGIGYDVKVVKDQ